MGCAGSKEAHKEPWAKGNNMKNVNGTAKAAPSHRQLARAASRRGSDANMAAAGPGLRRQTSTRRLGDASSQGGAARLQRGNSIKDLQAGRATTLRQRAPSIRNRDADDVGSNRGGPVRGAPSGRALASGPAADWDTKSAGPGAGARGIAGAGGASQRRMLMQRMLAGEAHETADHSPQRPVVRRTTTLQSRRQSSRMLGGQGPSKTMPQRDLEEAAREYEESRHDGPRRAAPAPVPRPRGTPSRHLGKDDSGNLQSRGSKHRGSSVENGSSRHGPTADDSLKILRGIASEAQQTRASARMSATGGPEPSPPTTIESHDVADAGVTPPPAGNHKEVPPPREDRAPSEETEEDTAKAQEGAKRNEKLRGAAEAARNNLSRARDAVKHGQSQSGSRGRGSRSPSPARPEEIDVMPGADRSRRGRDDRDRDYRRDDRERDYRDDRDRDYRRDPREDRDRDYRDDRDRDYRRDPREDRDRDYRRDPREDRDRDYRDDRDRDYRRDDRERDYRDDRDRDYRDGPEYEEQYVDEEEEERLAAEEEEREELQILEEHVIELQRRLADVQAEIASVKTEMAQNRQELRSIEDQAQEKPPLSSIEETDASDEETRGAGNLRLRLQKTAIVSRNKVLKEQLVDLEKTEMVFGIVAAAADSYLTMRQAIFKGMDMNFMGTAALVMFQRLEAEDIPGLLEDIVYSESPDECYERGLELAAIMEELDRHASNQALDNH
ncbi:unnamed protein product [Pedinophyceae sp. YPF-701]|nr:unnamed protein product [Pedinophyceae sp. YPF-701]